MFLIRSSKIVGKLTILITLLIRTSFFGCLSAAEDPYSDPNDRAREFFGRACSPLLRDSPGQAWKGAPASATEASRRKLIDDMASLAESLKEEWKTLRKGSSDAAFSADAARNLGRARYLWVKRYFRLLMADGAGKNALIALRLLTSAPGTAELTKRLANDQAIIRDYPEMFEKSRNGAASEDRAAKEDSGREEFTPEFQQTLAFVERFKAERDNWIKERFEILVAVGQQPGGAYVQLSRTETCSLCDGLLFDPALRQRYPVLKDIADQYVEQGLLSPPKAKRPAPDPASAALPVTKPVLTPATTPTAKNESDPYSTPGDRANELFDRACNVFGWHSPLPPWKGQPSSAEEAHRRQLVEKAVSISAVLWAEWRALEDSPPAAAFDLEVAKKIGHARYLWAKRYFRVLVADGAGFNALQTVRRESNDLCFQISNDQAIVEDFPELFESSDVDREKRKLDNSGKEELTPEFREVLAFFGEFRAARYLWMKERFEVLVAGGLDPADALENLSIETGQTANVPLLTDPEILQKYPALKPTRDQYVERGGIRAPQSKQAAPDPVRAESETTKTKPETAKTKPPSTTTPAGKKETDSDAQRKAKSLLSMAQQYIKFAKLKEAKSYAQKVIDAAPGSEEAKEAELILTIKE